MYYDKTAILVLIIKFSISTEKNIACSFIINLTCSRNATGPLGSLLSTYSTKAQYNTN